MNATDLVRSLDSDEIRQRLDELARERKALMTLLRAALARQQQSNSSDSGSCRDAS